MPELCGDVVFKASLLAFHNMHCHFDRHRHFAEFYRKSCMKGFLQLGGVSASKGLGAQGQEPALHPPNPSLKTNK